MLNSRLKKRSNDIFESMNPSRILFFPLPAQAHTFPVPSSLQMEMFSFQQDKTSVWVFSIT
ncbi:MAG: hypothetical protein CL666_01550 [Balneola sp.]|nr:hypothetical protein [Balneola sp.]